jgi:hypothetical protein
MSKLSRLMESSHSQSGGDSLKTLEITESVKVKVDPDAAKRDTTFWNTMRPIPLAPDELQSFQKRDSVVRLEQSKPKVVSIAQKKVNLGIFSSLFLGKRTTFRDSTWRFNYYGLFNFSRLTFNAVDGFTINQEFLFTKNYKPGRSLELRPRVAYAFNRETLMGNLGIKYNYAPMHRGTFEFAGGSYSEDFNRRDQAISPFINTVSSLFFKTNFARFYENRYLKFINNVDLVNGLVLQTKVAWKNVRQLDNSTNISFIDNKDNYLPNLPANDAVEAVQLADQILSTIGVRVEYTPKFYYQISNGIKKMSHSYFPTFYLGYEKGVKNIFSSTSDFDYFNAGINHSIEFSQTSSLFWEINGGLFTNSNQLHFSDFAHAMTQTSPVLPHEYRHSFYVPNYYALSTDNKFVNGFVSYKSPFIFLKYLPVLSNTLWREMVWAGYYSSPTNPNHMEVGYTLLEVLYSANVGVFAGFDKFQFTKFGINMSFRISY